MFQTNFKVGSNYALKIALNLFRQKNVILPHGLLKKDLAFRRHIVYGHQSIINQLITAMQIESDYIFLCYR